MSFRSFQLDPLDSIFQKKTMLVYFKEEKIIFGGKKK
jgi:hypothetical protein